VIPGFKNIAFSVIKKGEKVDPQIIGILNPSIRLQEIEVPASELHVSAKNNNLCLAGALKDGYFLLFHRCTVKSLVFESDYMILEENKKFCSSITILDNLILPSDSSPIDL
jgi:hypothetical protein